MEVDQVAIVLENLNVLKQERESVSKCVYNSVRASKELNDVELHMYMHVKDLQQ